MAGRQSPPRRSPEYVWLVTGTLAIIAIVFSTILGVQHDGWSDEWLAALVALPLFVLLGTGSRYIQIGRHGTSLSLSEIALVLGFYFLPAVLVVAVSSIAVVIKEIRRHAAPDRFAFNVARSAAAVATAGVVLQAFPKIEDSSPSSWVALSVAVTVNTVLTLFAVAAVMATVQGLQAGLEMLRVSWPGLVAAELCIVIGLVFIVALDATWWSAFLLFILAGVLILAYRSYSDFLRQHHTLAELYELANAVAESSQDVTLIDSLLVRARSLMQAEYATFHLPVTSRHPEVLLTAKVEAKGLLDLSRTPPEMVERATSERRSVAVGSRLTTDQDLRPSLAKAGIKDCIVVPLRSGQAVIGTLEVVNRLGDFKYFTTADVQVVETIAAHAAAAVENSRLVERLRYDAYHDRLTSLPNRRRITDALTESVKIRTPGEVVEVMLFDVDGLRDVNESMGHDAGDKLLTEVAVRLRKIAGPGALVGRIGGDEFVVTLRAESTEETVRLATEMREQLRGPMAVGTLTLDVDTAAGVAVQPDHGDDPDALLRRAELAANAAKALPYGVQLFHPALESRAVRRLGLAADLRRALDSGELEVHFQPKVTIQDRHLIGVECLARWQHPAHGEVSPEDFVAVAEHTGQLHRLTEVVLTAGLRHCREWADAGRPLSIAVNLSARTLLDPRFPDQVHELLKQYRVPPPQVTFEISEPSMLGEIERALPTLYRLRDLGVRLSVDDFGTGASSLSYLRQLPVHEVKIDDSFVQGMATDSGDLAIVRAVVGLSREFGLTVVAEGVESELTFDLLAEMGCEIGQGYFFSRPLPVERLNTWLSAQTEPEETPTGEVRRLRAVG
ncbi:putative bifunctional diguanylate cyclase/phosphodiesterase [Actinoplanes auranticolor]|uniref:Bifunctional diguanylate cyclase/phosphodiesterase n=1 Tax=Actinoplanes auranticolor TaxID=47988 RepID=A0A919S4H9_9ACTN|nr:sensor domain-containing phosphodiesterase [Actinoplanes auranticolor]GIM64780.1 bifunctional diguanylate cyclase/phosphodiesterase [Actinoplanes auranticolor]